MAWPTRNTSGSSASPRSAAKRHGPVLTRFGRHRLQHYPLTPEEASIFRRYTASQETEPHRLRRHHRDHRRLLCAAAGGGRCRRSRWDYILVDEFQDLNTAQYAIVRRLARPHGNLFAVGDDEQSIFSWTGADPGILPQFQKDYAVTPIILDENRRCSRQIFQAARKLLQENHSLFDEEVAGRAGFRARRAGAGVRARERRGPLVDRGHRRRSDRERAGLGRVRHSLPEARHRRASRDRAAAGGHPLPARARPGAPR